MNFSTQCNVEKLELNILFSFVLYSCTNYVLLFTWILILKVDLHLHVFTLVSLMIIKTFQVKLSVKKIVISHLYRHQLKSFADRPNHAFSMNFQQNNSRKSNNPFNLSQSKYLVLSIKVAAVRNTTITHKSIKLMENEFIILARSGQ